MSDDAHSSVLFNVAARGVQRRDLKAYAIRLQDEVAKGRAFSCLITSDQDLQRWNRQFRKKDYPTDVLSFPAEQAGGYVGEIAISFDRAREQAAEFGHSAAEELRILMLHGVLHLMGMDHETDRGEMEKTERRWRKRLGLPAGLIERVGL